MIRSEVATLLAMIAAYDRRTIGVADVESWAVLPIIERTDFALAREAVILFFDQEPPDRGPVPYMDPHHLRRYIRMAVERREIEEARERARRPRIEAGKDAYARPRNFAAMVEAATENFGRMP